MPCATCCPTPSSNTENTTRPPPGLPPSSPDVTPPTTPTATPPSRSPGIEPLQHLLDRANAGIDIDPLAPADLQYKPLQQRDQRPGDRVRANPPGNPPRPLTALDQRRDRRPRRLDARHHQRVDAIAAERLRPA